MADNLADYLEVKLLDHMTGKTAYTKPTNVYAALFTVAPTDAGGGTEVSGGGYARQQITWGGAVTAGNGDTTTANSADIRFPSGVADATTDWGSIVAFGVYDSLTDGNLLFYGSLSASVVVNSGDSFKLVTGALTVSLS